MLAINFPFNLIIMVAKKKNRFDESQQNIQVHVMLMVVKKGHLMLSGKVHSYFLKFVSEDFSKMV